MWIHLKNLTLLLTGLNKDKIHLFETMMTRSWSYKNLVRSLTWGAPGWSENCHNWLNDRQSHDSAAYVRVYACMLKGKMGLNKTQGKRSCSDIVALLSGLR